MAVDVLMPKLSDTMEEGKILKWYKREGDAVEKGEKIFEVETDKADMEVEAFDSGTMAQILVKEGQSAPVGTAIARIGAAGEKVEPAPAEVPAKPAEAPAPARAGGGRASPLARRVAEELGVDLSKVTGTGPEDRITKEDVELAAKTTPAAQAAPGASLEELSPMRRAIAKTVIKSKTEIPHFYVTVSIDMTEAIKLKKKLEGSMRSAGRKLTYTHLIVRAAVETIKKYPSFNWFYVDGKVQKNKDINIGVAVAVKDGLIIPAIKNCQDRTLDQVAEEENRLVEAARGGALQAGDLTGGTFTISNVGMLDVEHFQAIIYPPQSAILAVGSIKERPVVKGGKIQPVQAMNVTISVDHRILDGAVAARFLDDFKALLESPASLAS